MKCPSFMNIYTDLFSASITLAGFIAVFLVFRYRQIDTYVDLFKQTLMSLLKHEIDNKPRIAIMILDMWKEPNIDYIGCFQKYNNAAVNIVKSIYAYRIQRKIIVSLGLASICFWVLLSLFYLTIHAINPCPVGSISCSATLTGIPIGLLISSGVLLIIYVIGSCLFNSISCPSIVMGISIGFFIKSIALTLCFVCYSLLAKRPEPERFPHP
jgi:hypothetical protein